MKSCRFCQDAQHARLDGGQGCSRLVHARDEQRQLHASDWVERQALPGLIKNPECDLSRCCGSRLSVCCGGEVAQLK